MLRVRNKQASAGRPWERLSEVEEYEALCRVHLEHLVQVREPLVLVSQIQRKLEDDAARPVMSWRFDYFPIAPYVKNLVPHHNIYNYGRMQEVWLDK